MTAHPAESGSYPSQDLTWQELDAAMIVVVVDARGQISVWAEDHTAYPAHAAMLRSVANRLDPPET